MNKGIGIAVIAVLGSLAACSEEGDGGVPSQTKALIEDEYGAWLVQDIADYGFRFSETCFCFPYRDVQITVRDGVITEAFLIASGEYLADEDLAELRTIDELYDLLIEVMDDAYAITALDGEDPPKFDARFEYPASVYIDRANDVADDEYGWRVDDFVPAE